MTDDGELLRLEDLSKSYAGITVLREVSFELRRGEVVAIAGENGAGKSTVLSIITGLVRPSAGTVTYSGRSVPDNWSPAQARLAGVSSVQQELSVNPHQTVAENIFMGRWPTHLGLVPGRGLNRAAEQLLERVGLDCSPRTPVRQLPLGKRQLVEIAKALVVNPKLLILDEATSALDDEQVDRIFGLVRELRSAGTTTILVTHRMGEMFHISDRFVILKDGALVEVRDRAATTEDQLIHAMLGRSMTELFPTKTAVINDANDANGTAGLSVQGLSVGEHCHEIDVAVPPGRIVGLGGLQGQGQREVLRALFGLEKHRGKVRFDGRQLNLTTPGAAIRNHIAFVPEDRKDEGVLLEHTVAQNLELPNLRTLSPWSRLTTVSVRASRQLVTDLITALQIKATPAQTTRRLSGGNQQKVSLAKWLPTRPKLLLLAEPTRGIDIGTKREIYQMLRNFAADGMSILLTSGDTLELIGLCDEVAVMYEGRIVTVLRGDQLTEARLVEASVRGAHRSDSTVAAPVAGDAA